MLYRCGKCKKTGHNKRTCPEVNVVDTEEAVPIEGNEDEAVPIEGNDDEAEMQAAYAEIAVEVDGPPLTQPSQMEEDVILDEEAPIEIAARRIRELRSQKLLTTTIDSPLTTTMDSPLMLAVSRIKKMKEKQIEVAKEDKEAEKVVKQKEAENVLKDKEAENKFVHEEADKLKFIKEAAQKLKQKKKLHHATMHMRAETVAEKERRTVTKQEMKKRIGAVNTCKLKEKKKVDQNTMHLPSETVAEEERRKVIKEEMEKKIEAITSKSEGKSSARAKSPAAVRRSNRLYIKQAFKFTNTPENPVCLDDDGDTIMAEGPSSQKTEKHNTYTGPMMLGKKMPPPVKQFKTIIGKTKLQSAPFLSHGKNVITPSALHAAIQETTRNLMKEGKEKQIKEGKKKES